MAKPHFFRYTGAEGFQAVTAAEEFGSTFIYATGYAQANWANNTAVLTKYDTNGNLLWSRILGDPGWEHNSGGTDLTVVNDAVYVAGWTHYPYTDPNARRTALWKVNSGGTVVWWKSSRTAWPEESRERKCSSFRERNTVSRWSFVAGTSTPL